MALTEVLAGLHDDARARLRAYAADLDVLDFGAIWVPALVALAEVCRIVDAPECAAPIYERLDPPRRRCAWSVCPYQKWDR